MHRFNGRTMYDYNNKDFWLINNFQTSGEWDHRTCREVLKPSAVLQYKMKNGISK